MRYEALQACCASVHLSPLFPSLLHCLLPSSILPSFPPVQGTPDEPRCKFSRRVVDALRSEGVTFGSFDILTSDDVREGLKRLMQWPTYPQLYHKGELVGGCDIIMEMKEGGELKAVLTA